MKQLTVRQILLLHEQLIQMTGGSGGLREESLLESAAAAPYQAYDEKELFPTLLEKAARLGYGLVKNHAFVDGNKRIGAHAMLVFLAINDVDLAYTQSELVEVILGVAAGEKEYEDLLAWLKSHVRS